MGAVILRTVLSWKEPKSPVSQGRGFSLPWGFGNGPLPRGVTRGSGYSASNFSIKHFATEIGYLEDAKTISLAFLLEINRTAPA